MSIVDQTERPTTKRAEPSSSRRDSDDDEAAAKRPRGADGGVSDEDSDDDLLSCFGASSKFAMREPAKASKSDSIYLHVYGDAKVSVRPMPHSKQLEESDIQQLVLWLLGSGLAPKWASVTHTSLVSKINVLLMGGLGREAMSPRDKQLRPLLDVFAGAIRVETLCRSRDLRVFFPLSRLLSVSMKTPGMKHEWKRMRDWRNRKSTPSTSDSNSSDSNSSTAISSNSSSLTSMSSDSSNSTTMNSDSSSSTTMNSDSSNSTTMNSDSSSSTASSSTGSLIDDLSLLTEIQQLEMFLHPEHQLIEHGYPLPDHTLPDVSYDGFIACEAWEAERWQQTPTAQRVLAIDCEMCSTTEGIELTRVSVVDFDGGLLFDTLVLPHARITDYKTQYSGITAEALREVTTRLSDVQERLRQLIAAQTILVGHSLENDLIALKLFHRRVLDTAILYPRLPSGPQRYSKLSLRQLAVRFLNEDIRMTGGQLGHCSIEDATTALKLARLKGQRGWLYGTPSTDTVPLFELCDYKRIKACLLANADVVRRYSQNCGVSAIATTDHDQHVAATEAQMAAHSPNRLVISQFDRFSARGAEPLTADDYVWLGCTVRRLLAAAPSQSVTVLLTGPEPPATLNDLVAMKNRTPPSQWSSECERQLQKVFAQTRAGFAYIFVK